MSILSSRSSWRIVKFGDVVRNANLVERDPAAAGIERIVGLEHLDSENLHIRRWDSPEEGTSFTRKFVPGQTLFGKRRAYQRKVAYAEFEGICSGDILTFEPVDPNILLPQLLPFICQTDRFFDYALGTSAGSLSPRTSWSALKEFDFPLPPIEEQRRIAEILWAVDEVMEEYWKIGLQLDLARTALQNQIVSVDSQKMQLGDVVTYASDGPFGSKLKTEHYEKSGARVVRLQNIDAGHFDDADKAYISLDYHSELKRYWLHAGDLVIAGLGDESHPVGRACLVPKELGPAVNKADCFCIRPNPDIVLPEYLCFFLNSGFAQREMKRITQGTTRYRINVSNVKTVVTLVPSLAMQSAFIQRTREIDMAERQLRQHIERLKGLSRELASVFVEGDGAANV